MAWSHGKSQSRIEKFRNDLPINDVVVEQFSEYYSRRTIQLREALRTDPNTRTDPILDLKYNRAVVTDGTHIYVNLMDFNAQMFGGGASSENVQKKALEFLHLHYGASDRLVQDFGIQRVDYHGHRLHAVVLTPEGDAHRGERIMKALAFAEAFIKLVETNNELYSGRYRTDVRIGIDDGKAVAINSGRGSEPEPLFIGSPANHAAKQAEGDDAGVFLTPRVSAFISGQNRVTKSTEFPQLLTAANNIELRAGVTIQKTVSDIQESYRMEATNQANVFGVPAVFNFHRHSIPLKTIDYQNHPPSNSIRMEMATHFSDIVGFTNYIDNAIQNNAINEVVSNLHIIRRELVACLRDDFGGKKVRFIGDCLHSVSAKGNSYNADDKETVQDAILLAGGLRSSFNLLKQMLPNMSSLDLAIGIDYGFAPISRIGLQGISSIRCSVSHSTCEAEDSQQECQAYETKISANAKEALPAPIYVNIPKDNILVNLDFENAEILVNGLSGASIQNDAFKAHGG